MNKNVINTEDLLNRFPNFAGDTVSIQGHILVNGERAFIAKDYQAFIEGKCVPIVDDGTLLMSLWETLSPYVGGKCYYDEEAVVEGMVRISEHDALYIDLISCIVRRGNVELIVPPVGAGERRPIQNYVGGAVNDAQLGGNLISVNELNRRTGLSVKAIRTLVKRGVIPSAVERGTSGGALFDLNDPKFAEWLRTFTTPCSRTF